MYCDECKERPATVHLTKILNNKKTEVHLCEQCAKERQDLSFNFEPSFSIHKFLANLFNEGLGNQLVVGKPRDTEGCRSCSLTFDQFGQVGRLGCGDCYTEFRSSLEPLLRRIHGSTRHTGKVPRRTGGTIRLRHEIEGLRKEMNAAVSAEDFEKAAELRDKIKELEKRVK